MWLQGVESSDATSQSAFPFKFMFQELPKSEVGAHAPARRLNRKGTAPVGRGALRKPADHAASPATPGAAPGRCHGLPGVMACQYRG